MKTAKKLKCLTSPKIIPQEQLQHNGIRSHLVYVNLQYCNVCLSNFDKFQLLIVNRSKSIHVISNFQLKNGSYHIMWSILQCMQLCFNGWKSINFKFFPHKYHVSNQVLSQSHQFSIFPSMFQLSINNNETCYDTNSYVSMAKL